MRDHGGPGRLTTGIAAALLGAALLTGCSAPQQAATTLPPASTPSPVAEEPELVPLGPPDLPMPAEARAQTPEGAQAFVRYYMDVYNHALQSLDPTHLADLSRGCERCDMFVRQVNAAATDGLLFEGGAVSVNEVTRPALDAVEAQFAVSITQAALAMTKDGAPIDGRTYPEAFLPASGGILAWDTERDTWLMSQLDVQ